MESERLKHIRQVVKESNKTDQETIIKYACETCSIITTDEEVNERLAFFLGKIRTGDIVFCPKGLYLVTDEKPKANVDNHHFRAIKIQINENGEYVICGETRSLILHDIDAFRIRTSTFDLKKIERYSYERYMAYKRISEINAELCNIREQ